MSAVRKISEPFYNAGRTLLNADEELTDYFRPLQYFKLNGSNRKIPSSSEDEGGRKKKPGSAKVKHT